MLKKIGLGILIVIVLLQFIPTKKNHCLLYTSDAADERSSVDLGGRRIIKQKTNKSHRMSR